MEVGGSMGRSSSLAVVFLIMLLSNPSQVILGTYFLYSLIPLTLYMIIYFSIYNIKVPF